MRTPPKLLKALVTLVALDAQLNRIDDTIEYVFPVPVAGVNPQTSRTIRTCP
jgi:hypothetical protein